MLKIGVPKEPAGEQRVALTPEIAGRFSNMGIEVLVETGAGSAAMCPDSAYRDAGATLVNGLAELYASADIIARVQSPTPTAIRQQKPGGMAIGFMQPEKQPALMQALCEQQITSIAMELIPRLPRAQSMDALSSQAAVAGYKAMLLAADRLARFIPMLTTPTGTLPPAKAIILGASVSGLQAMATARRLGAVVEAYDPRPEMREQVESLGVKFLPIHAPEQPGGGSMATAAERQLQQDILSKYLAQADIVVVAASCLGDPYTVTGTMLAAMRPGSVLIDLLAETGEGCELSRSGQEVITERQVLVLAPLNLPSLLAVHASEIYAKNLWHLLQLVIKSGRLEPEWEDEIIKASLLTRAGKILYAPANHP